MALGVVSLSVTNTFLLLPPAAPEPDRLVTISSHSAGEAIGQISYPDYKYFRENNHVFTDVAAAPNSIGINANSDGTHEVKVINTACFRQLFYVMGVRPSSRALLLARREKTKEPSP